MKHKGLKNVTENSRRICPLCGKAYTEAPALSRDDNYTMICSDCGTRQALASIGVGKEEQEKILETIHKSMKEKN